MTTAHPTDLAGRRGMTGMTGMTGAGSAAGAAGVTSVAGATATTRMIRTTRLALAAALSAVAGQAFTPVFGGYGPPGHNWRVQLVLLGSIAVPVVLAGAVAAWTRLTPPVRAAVLFAGLVLYVTLTVGAGLSVLDGPKRLLTTTLPVRAEGPELAAVVLATGLAALCSAELVLRHRGGLLPALPPLVCAVGGLAVGASAGPPATWLGPVFTLLAAAQLALTHALSAHAPSTHAPSTSARPPAVAGAVHTRPSGPRLAGEAGRPGIPTRSPLFPVAAATAGAVAAATVAVALAPIAAGSRTADTPFDAQSLVEQSVTPRSTVSPLVEFPALLAGREPGLELIIHTDARLRLERLRTATLTEFDGIYWSSSATYRRADQRLPEPAPGTASPGDEVEITVTVGSGSPTWLPTPGRAVQLSTSGMGVDTSTGDVVVPSDHQVPSHYTVTGIVPSPEAARLHTDVPVTSRERPSYVLPPTIRATAARETAGGRTPYEQVAKVRDFFRDAGGFRYDADADALAGHGLYQISQLLEQRRGTAEQYASALAVMLHSLGYQARVVFGYLPRYDEASGTYRVSGREAHAWTEVLFAESGWVQFDPSPLDHHQRAGAAPDAPTQPAPGRDPGDDLTVQPPSRAGNGPAPERPLVAGPAGERDGSGATSPILAIATIIVSLALAMVIAIPAAKTARASRRKRTGDVRSRVVEAWREARGRLADVGLPIHAGHTGAEVAAVVREHLSPQVSSPVTELARVHQAAVFAPSHPREREADRAWAAVTAIRRQLRAEVPALRRVRAQFSLTSLRRPDLTPTARRSQRLARTAWKTGETRQALETLETRMAQPPGAASND